MPKHEVFVSYKYSDALETKNRIMSKLMTNGHYYHGEKGFCPLDKADDSMKQYLSKMIFGTSVTVVVISPQAHLSDWIEWEIKYSLRKETRNDIQSQRNGIVCVIQGNRTKEFDFNSLQYRERISSDWAYLATSNGNKLNPIYLPSIIRENMEFSFHEFNSLLRTFGFNETNSSIKDYCVVVSESTFLSDPDKYIEEAFKRANDSSFKIKINI